MDVPVKYHELQLRLYYRVLKYLGEDVRYSRENGEPWETEVSAR